MATLATVQSILKTYFHAPVTKQINEECLLFELLKKKAVTWMNNTAVVPVQTFRNRSGAFRPELGVLPDPVALGATATLGYSNYSVNAAYAYGVFRITGQAMAVGEGGESSIVDVLESEIDGAVETIVNTVNRELFSGNMTIGFLHQYQNVAGATDWQFVGDWAKLALALAEEAVAVGVGAHIRRMDTYANVLDVHITNPNEAAGTIRITEALDTTVGAAMPQGVAFCVELMTPAEAVIFDALLAGCPNTADAAAYGIMAGIGQQTIHGLNRSAAANASLRSFARTMGTAGAQAWTVLDPARLQVMNALVFKTSGKTPDFLWMGAMTRTEYAALMVQTAGLSKDTSKASKGDLGFTGYSLNGVDVHTSQHCPEGCCIFMTTDTWRYVDKGEAAIDETGGILQRENNLDSYKGMAKYYYNLVPMQPNANGIMTGIRYPLV